jgi:hypothetical protein
LLPKDPESIGRDFSQSTLEQRKDLMVAVQSMMLSFKISGGILSIHRGSWLSKPNDNGNEPNEFHAHLCVDTELYTDIFKREKVNIPKEFKWPYYVNATSYPLQVSAYPRKSYFDKEVNIIKELKLRDSVNLLPCVQQLMDEIGQMEFSRLLLHPSEPKIGFVGKKDEIHLENLVWAMEHFAAFLGLTNPGATNENDGCHLCLQFGSGKFIYTAC